MGKIRVFSGMALLFIGGGMWNKYVHNPPVTSKFLWAAFAVWYAICYVNLPDGRYRRPVLFFNRYVKTLGPRLSLLDPLLFNTLKDICVQEDTEEIAVEAKTRDGVDVTFTLLATWQIDPNRVEDAVMQVHNVFESRVQLARAIAFEAISLVSLDNLLAHRGRFTNMIKQELARRVERWGVIVTGLRPSDFQITDPVVARAIAARTRLEAETKYAEAFNEAGSKFTSDGRFLRFVEAMENIGSKGERNLVAVPLPLKFENLMRPSAQNGRPAPQTADTDKRFAPQQTSNGNGSCPPSQTTRPTLAERLSR